MPLKPLARAIASTALLIAINVHAATAEPPRLILQITVDALRADLPTRYQQHYGKGGWQYLFNKGTRYSNAHYAHANTETIVGHSSLATGAYPADHGMVANVWFDRARGALHYNIEDPDYPLLTVGGGVDQSREIDPTQRTATSDGRSPRAIRVSTFADELASSTAGEAKIFAVSVKDRGAVSLAGHAGKAFWFSKATGQFVTSSYYYQRYPEWVESWNTAAHPQRYADGAWALSGAPDEYLFGSADDVPWETDFPTWGRTFPHPYGLGDGKYFTTFLTLSPAGDELTLDFAKALVENEAIGTDRVTDFLAVSFSSTDYINHLFGPSSLEAEDNQRRLDRTLAELFKFIDDKVGLKHTLIVLSADHGSPEVPGYLNSLNIPAQNFDISSIEDLPGITALKERLGLAPDARLIETYFHPYLYLDRELLATHSLDQVEVQDAVAAEIFRVPGVTFAVGAGALETGRLSDTWQMRSVRNNHDPERSGDIYLVLGPQTFVNDFDGLSVAATHGSLWSYDGHVPIIFAGHAISAGKISRYVTPYDIAPTLSAYLGIPEPSASRGQPLGEVASKGRAMTSTGRR